MTYNRFNELYKTNNLPQEDYSTYVARDAHMTSKKRSTLRYGTHNECPPKKKYYINKGLKEQSYDLYISDTKRDGKVLHKRARWIKKWDCYSWWVACRICRMLNNPYSKLWE